MPDRNVTAPRTGEPADTASRARGHVAVADDDPIVRETLAACLAPDGHEVSTFADGDELIDSLDYEIYDLFIVDLIMPGADGFAVLEAVKQVPVHAVVPTMIISSRQDSLALERADQLGVSGYLLKPIDWQCLHFQIRGLLRLARAEQQARALLNQAENRMRLQQYLGTNRGRTPAPGITKLRGI